MINKPVVDPLTQHIKANAEKLSEFFGYIVPSITSIDMREMYCQGYLQAIQDLKTPSRATIAAMCLQGLLANKGIIDIIDSTPTFFDLITKSSVAAADSLLINLENTLK